MLEGFDLPAAISCDHCRVGGTLKSREEGALKK